MSTGDNNEANKTITVTPEQAAQLAAAFEFAKALAAPSRMAIVGALVPQNKAEPAGKEEESSILLDGLSIEELSAATGIKAAAMERDLRQLENAGLISITEWAAPQARFAVLPERVRSNLANLKPARVRFNLVYLKAIPQIITVLHQLHAQIEPAEKVEKLDERDQVLQRFMPNGRIVALPVQQKRVMYIIEEVAKAFEPKRTYSEREVDAILKGFYPEDHCTVRRYLVDSGLMTREANVYWKAEAVIPTR
jgi:hypothetical protein